MKTTVEIPDELYRAAKAKAALEGLKLKDLVTEGLRLVVQGRAVGSARVRAHLPLVRSGNPGSLDLTGEEIAAIEARLDAGHGSRPARSG